MILREVRTSANKVAVKVTVLSGNSGMFILIRRWKKANRSQISHVTTLQNSLYPGPYKWQYINRVLFKRALCCKLPDWQDAKSASSPVKSYKWKDFYFYLPCKRRSLDISCLFQLVETFVVTIDILQCAWCGPWMVITTNKQINK